MNFDCGKQTENGAFKLRRAVKKKFSTVPNAVVLDSADSSLGGISCAGFPFDELFQVFTGESDDRGIGGVRDLC